VAHSSFVFGLSGQPQILMCFAFILKGYRVIAVVAHSTPKAGVEWATQRSALGFQQHRELFLIAGFGKNKIVTAIATYIREGAAIAPPVEVVRGSSPGKEKDNADRWLRNRMDLELLFPDLN
jgi:hypothetical protein